MGKPFIGCSGFSYPHWKGNFYPEDLPEKQWLRHYSERFSTVELNVTFYRLPTRETFREWHRQTPKGFIFSLKGSRLITHVKKLRAPKEPLANFMEAAGALKEKLGVVLWQLPPGFAKDRQRIEGFLKALRPYGLKNAFEFRDDSWIDREITALFAKEGQSFCMADWPPFVNDLPATAEFVYIRKHGLGGKYNSCYSEREIEAEADRIRTHLKQERNVFVYLNNDAFGYAPKNALELKEILAEEPAAVR